MDWLQAQDQALLLAINGSHTPFWDGFMTVVSGKFTWIPLYLLLAFLLYRAQGWKRMLLTLGVVGLVILMCDQTASTLLKPLIGRPRPCHVDALRASLHLVGGKCGSAFGFASSHAANFFGLATFVGWSLRDRHRFLVWGLFLIAGLVAISRVYLGVHYPGDILGGAMIGIMMGFFGIFVSKSVANRLNFPQTQQK